MVSRLASGSARAAEISKLDAHTASNPACSASTAPRPLCAPTALTSPPSRRRDRMRADFEATIQFPKGRYSRTPPPDGQAGIDKAQMRAVRENDDQLVRSSARARIQKYRTIHPRGYGPTLWCAAGISPRVTGMAAHLSTGP